MKVLVRCVNCNEVIRRSNCFHVKLQDVYRDDSGSFERPNWIMVDEIVWICKPCAMQAGYNVKQTKTKTNGHS